MPFSCLELIRFSKTFGRRGIQVHVAGERHTVDFRQSNGLSIQQQFHFQTVILTSIQEEIESCLLNPDQQLAVSEKCL
jgi:hypothetical protein